MKPFVVVVIIATSRAGPGATPAIEDAAQDALEPSAVVLVRHADAPSNAEVLHVRDAANADAVAVVTWPDVAHAHVRVLPSSSKRWLERDLTFSDSDALDERGRFVGFALGAMIPPRREASPSPPAPAPEPGVQALPAERPHERRGAIDLVATSGFGIDGYGGGFGSELSFRYRVALPVAVRAGFGIRVGSIEPANIQTRTAQFSAGLAIRAWHTPDMLRPLHVALRVDGIVVRQGLSHAIFADAVSRGVRWVGGLDLLLEGGWDFVPEAAFIAAVGSEIVFGTTRVVLDNDERADLAKVRLVAELGMRVRF